MKYGLEEILFKESKLFFLSFPEIDEVILYGSRAKGNYKPGSDIDLVIKGDQLNLSTLNKSVCSWMNYTCLISLIFPFTITFKAKNFWIISKE